MSLTIAPPANGLFYESVEWAAIQMRLAASFYLLRNDGPSGERFRCKRHSLTVGVSEPVYHDFFTLLCVPRPFNWEGVQKMYGQVRVATSDRPSRVPGAPAALADLHPRTARTLVPDGPGEDWLAFLLGTAEPIDAWRAQQYADEIRRLGMRPFALQPMRLRSAALRGGEHA